MKKNSMLFQTHAQQKGNSTNEFPTSGRSNHRKNIVFCLQWFFIGVLTTGIGLTVVIVLYIQKISEF